MNKLITTSKIKAVDNFCGQCGSDVVAADNFCRHCGTPCHEYSVADESVPVQVIARRMPGSTGSESAGSESAVTSDVTDGSRQQVANTMETILNNRLYIYGIMALVGPLGLPALWFSPRFSRRTKTIITIIFILLTTVVPLAIAWYFLDYSLRPLVDAFGR